MVKVHSSHLEEVDQYIMDLRSKLEESETKRKGAEVALAVQDLKRAASLDAATLVQVPNKHDGRPLAYSLSLDNRNDSLCVRTRASFDAGVRSGHFSVPGVQDHSWELGNPSGRLGFLAASWCCANPSMESSLTFIYTEFSLHLAILYPM
jgi:myosin protein heavy chain